MLFKSTKHLFPKTTKDKDSKIMALLLTSLTFRRKMKIGYMYFYILIKTVNLDTKNINIIFELS